MLGLFLKSAEGRKTGEGTEYFGMLLNILDLKVLSNAAFLVLTFLVKEGAVHSEEVRGNWGPHMLSVNSALSPNVFYSTSGPDPTCLASQITINLSPLFPPLWVSPVSSQF